MLKHTISPAITCYMSSYCTSLELSMTHIYVLLRIGTPVAYPVQMIAPSPLARTHSRIVGVAIQISCANMHVVDTTCNQTYIHNVDIHKYRLVLDVHVPYARIQWEATPEPLPSSALALASSAHLRGFSKSLIVSISAFEHQASFTTTCFGQ